MLLCALLVTAVGDLAHAALRDPAAIQVQTLTSALLKSCKRPS